MRKKSAQSLLPAFSYFPLFLIALLFLLILQVQLDLRSGTADVTGLAFAGFGMIAVFFANSLFVYLIFLFLLLLLSNIIKIQMNSFTAFILSFLSLIAGFFLLYAGYQSPIYSFLFYLL